MSNPYTNLFGTSVNGIAALNVDAIYCDGTDEYVRPSEPNPGDVVTFLIRVKGENASRVVLHSFDRAYNMHFEEHVGQFDYYSVQIQMNKDAFRYYFEVVGSDRRVFYDRVGVTENVRQHYAFCVVPGFSVPAWSKGAVMYQILVDRFFNGDETNDVLDNEYTYNGTHSTKAKSWDDMPVMNGTGEFYGGDLEGVRQKLDYLQKLGVDVIYFNPIFVSPSNHKYDIQDYDHIDPHYGRIVVDEGRVLENNNETNREATKHISRVTDVRNLEASNEKFAELVEEIHKRGMKVILDGVFNHCGSFNKWLDRERIYENQPGYEPGAYVSADSPYRDWFFFFDNNKWPYNGTYDGWWGYDTLPKLNYEGSKELRDYILGVAAKWVSPPYNADGWRLDVAADLGHSPEYNHQFWRDFRDAVKKANPNAIILAENYGDSSSWLQGDQWDTIMNYDAFMEPVTYYLTGMEKHGDEYHGSALGNIGQYIGTMQHNMTQFLTPSLYCAMNELSNHDHSRFLTRTNHKVGRVTDLGYDAASQNVDMGAFRAAVMIQMTWPGAPTLYYGDEAGQVGFTDPDNRRTYPWGHENVELIDYHRDLIQLHKFSYTLRCGSFKFLPSKDNLLCYGRFTRDEQYVVVVNSGKNEEHITVPVWQLGAPNDGMMKQKIQANQLGYSLMPRYHRIKNGELELIIKPNTSILLKHSMGYEELYDR